MACVLGLCFGHHNLVPPCLQGLWSRGQLISSLSHVSLACTWTAPWKPSQQQPFPGVKLQCHLLVTRKPAGQDERKGKKELRGHCHPIWPWHLSYWTSRWTIFPTYVRSELMEGALYLQFLLTKNTQACPCSQSPFFTPLKWHPLSPQKLMPQAPWLKLPSWSSQGVDPLYSLTMTHRPHSRI